MTSLKELVVDYTVNTEVSYLDASVTKSIVAAPPRYADRSFITQHQNTKIHANISIKDLTL